MLCKCWWCIINSTCSDIGKLFTSLSSLITSHSYRKIILHFCFSLQLPSLTSPLSLRIWKVTDINCIALRASVHCKSLISPRYGDRRQRGKHGQSFPLQHAFFSNLIGNWSHGFATPPTPPPCWCAPALIHSSLNNWSSSSSRSALTCFFALMLEMSLRLQTSGVKSLSSRDSFTGGSRTSSKALNRTLLWQKETAASVYNSPQHNGGFELTIRSSVKLSAHFCEASIILQLLLCHCALTEVKGWRDHKQNHFYTPNISHTHFLATIQKMNDLVSFQEFGFNKLEILHSQSTFILPYIAITMQVLAFLSFSLVFRVWKSTGAVQASLPY